jgi:hypothetical protein
MQASSAIAAMGSSMLIEVPSSRPTIGPLTPSMGPRGLRLYSGGGGARNGAGICEDVKKLSDMSGWGGGTTWRLTMKGQKGPQPSPEGALHSAG